MKTKGPLIARILLGFIFAAGGIAHFLKLAPPPEGLPENLMTFNAGLEASIFFMPFLKATETICGLLLLSGFFVPLALVILAPIVLNITLVTVFMMPAGWPIPLVLILLLGYLAFCAQPYASVIKPLFRKN